MLIKKKEIETKIEIVVLTYNNLQTTTKFLSLLYKYTSDFNLTIVDNNSTDGTREYLRQLDYNNLTLFFNGENEGIIRGRNIGYGASINPSRPAEFIIFLDNDQFVKEGWLESYFNLIDKGYDVVGVEAWQMRDDFYPFKRIQSLNETFSYVGCGSMMIRHDVIKYIGLFDERFSPFYFGSMRSGRGSEFSLDL